MSRLKLCVYLPKLEGLNASLFSCVKTFGVTDLLFDNETNEEHVSFKAVMGFGSYKGKCASHLSSVQADVTLCLFLSSAQCRFCCVPLPDNALHIQRRQPVGTWGYNTLPSCTGLFISLLLFSPLFCMETLYSHLPLSSIVVVTTCPVFWYLHELCMLGIFSFIPVLLSGFPPFVFPSLFPHSRTVGRSSPEFSPSLFQGTSCSRWLRSTDRSRCSWRRWLVFQARRVCSRADLASQPSNSSLDATVADPATVLLIMGRLLHARL